jgi:hypothetical protein
VSNRDETAETRLDSAAIVTIFVALAIESRYPPLSKTSVYRTPKSMCRAACRFNELSRFHQEGFPNRSAIARLRVTRLRDFPDSAKSVPELRKMLPLVLFPVSSEVAYKI